VSGSWELGIPLLTVDGHFNYVKGLQVINWMKEKGGESRDDR